jgi:hypothetical protein
VKSDIDNELRAEELKRVMEQQAKSIGMHEILEETQESLDEMNKPDYLVKAQETAPKTAADAEQAENSVQAASSASPDSANKKKDDEHS